MIIPGGVGDHSIMYIVERVAAESFRFVIVNTDPLRGLSYHPSSVHRPPKIMYCSFLSLVISATSFFSRGLTSTRYQVQDMSGLRQCSNESYLR